MSRCLLHRDKVSPRLLHRDKVSLCLLHRDKVSPRLPMCKNFVPLENPARASELNHARLNHFGETTAPSVITRQRGKVKPNIIMAPAETVYWSRDRVAEEVASLAPAAAKPGRMPSAC